MAIGGLRICDTRMEDDAGAMPTVVQMTKELTENSAGADTEKTSDHNPQSGGSVGTDWRELAERRLARLVDAERDVSVLRDRLELLQSECREFLVLSVTRLQRINELERDLVTILASRSWRWTTGLRRLATWLLKVKVAAKQIVRRLVKLPLLRPIVKMIVRLLPGLSARLHAKLHASRL
jgi:hypothetical protein